MPPMSDASERIFQDKVEQIAKMNGWLIFHASPHMVRPGVWRSDGKGFPDLVLCHRTRGFIFAELKAKKDAFHMIRMMWAEALLNAGVEHYVWRPNQLDLIAARLGREAQ
jgi:hypothetical protein